MKTPLLSALLLIGCSVALLAKIGDTEAQIEASYGKPLRQWIDYLGYKKLYHLSGFNVSVNYSGGISQMERFQRLDGYLSEREIKTLSKMSAAGRPDVVSYDDNSVLTVTTRSFEKKTAAARRAGFTNQESSRQGKP
jgi:hypothetical protein